MKFLNFGSVNIDRVYSVGHFVRPGETLLSGGVSIVAGGKGFNQSIALARAGARVCHFGAIGSDGLWLKEILESEGVDTALLLERGDHTGHAIIQVDKEGENSIIIVGGGNRLVSPPDVDAAMAGFGKGDVLLVQNETSSVPYALSLAKKRSMRTVFNPAPFDESLLSAGLENVDLFILNEIEAAGLARCEEENPEELLRILCALHPSSDMIVTLGERGAIGTKAGRFSPVAVPAPSVEERDTTAAGDTFVGYFLASDALGMGFAEAMEIAVRASSISVSRFGASPSIPKREELGF